MDRDEHWSAAMRQNENLIRRIAASSATAAEKRVLQATLAELVTSADEAVSTWRRRASQHGCDVDRGDPDCG